jgi:hypothetical protein
VTRLLVLGGDGRQKVDSRLTSAVSTLWASYREQLQAGSMLSVDAKRSTPTLSMKPKAVKDRALKKRRREEAHKEDKEELGEYELDLVASLSLDCVLACVYAAARLNGISLAASEITQSCWQGALP